MSDFRYDPVFGQWVCIAESRQARPVEFRQNVQRLPGLDCPFCPGNEHLTPPALIEYPGDDGWLVRVFPNKYPALGPGSQSAAESPAGFDTPAIADGRQEVIVVSPRHVVSLSDLQPDELAACMEVFYSRVSDYWSDPDVCHVALFMNCRPLAGASIEHVHFQLMGSPVCTDQVKIRTANMTGQKNGKTVWQDLLQREQEARIRMVDQSSGFTVFCPFASRYTGQLRFAPEPGEAFPQFHSGRFVRLGQQLARWTRVMETVLEQPAYNLVFYFPPTARSDGPWFVDLIPRFPQFAGFELATDCWVNPLSPETAARLYRDAG